MVDRICDDDQTHRHRDTLPVDGRNVNDGPRSPDHLPHGAHRLSKRPARR